MDRSIHMDPDQCTYISWLEQKGGLFVLSIVAQVFSLTGSIIYLGLYAIQETLMINIHLLMYDNLFFYST